MPIFFEGSIAYSVEGSILFLGSRFPYTTRGLRTYFRHIFRIHPLDVAVEIAVVAAGQFAFDNSHAVGSILAAGFVPLFDKTPAFAAL